MDISCLAFICWDWWREHSEWQTLLFQATKPVTKTFETSFSPEFPLPEPSEVSLGCHSRAGMWHCSCGAATMDQSSVRSSGSCLAVASTQPLPGTAAEMTENSPCLPCVYLTSSCPEADHPSFTPTQKQAGIYPVNPIFSYITQSKRTF